MQDQELLYATARSIQDRFCALEDIGFSFNNESNTTVIDRVKSKFFSKGHEITSLQVARLFENRIPVDVVIPIYGESPSLLECLDTVEKSIGISPRVFLVDNGCDPLTIKKAQAYPCVHETIVNQQNEGFGGGCDQGVRASDSEYVVLLNSDAFVETDALRILLDELANNTHLGICASTCFFSDGTIQEAGRVLNSEAHSFGLREHGQNDLPSPRLLNVLYSSFVCVAIRRTDYERVGGFDSRFTPAYSEDVDLCIRFWENKSAVGVSYDARVMHALGESSENLDDIHVIKEKNREYVKAKYADYFASLPSLDDPQRYPHEFNLARTKHLNERILFLAIGMPPTTEFSSSLDMNEEDLVNCEIGLVNLDSHFDAKTWRQENSHAQFIDLYDSDEMQLHHWLRERICLYDIIHVRSNESSAEYSEELSLIMVTQPFAEWIYS